MWNPVPQNTPIAPNVSRHRVAVRCTAGGCCRGLLHVWQCEYVSMCCSRSVVWCDCTQRPSVESISKSFLPGLRGESYLLEYTTLWRCHREECAALRDTGSTLLECWASNSSSSSSWQCAQVQLSGGMWAVLCACRVVFVLR